VERVGTVPAWGSMFPACARKLPTRRRMVAYSPRKIPNVRGQDPDAARKESNAPKNRPDGSRPGPISLARSAR
jgi:hypothetical protein